MNSLNFTHENTLIRIKSSHFRSHSAYGKCFRIILDFIVLLRSRFDTFFSCNGTLIYYFLRHTVHAIFFNLIKFDLNLNLIKD